MTQLPYLAPGFDLEHFGPFACHCAVAEVCCKHGGRTHAEGGCLLNGIEVKQFPSGYLPVAA